MDALHAVRDGFEVDIDQRRISQYGGHNLQSLGRCGTPESHLPHPPPLDVMALHLCSLAKYTLVKLALDNLPQSPQFATSTSFSYFSIYFEATLLAKQMSIYLETQAMRAQRRRRDAAAAVGGSHNGNTVRRRSRV